MWLTNTEHLGNVQSELQKLVDAEKSTCRSVTTLSRLSLSKSPYFQSTFVAGALE